MLKLLQRQVAEQFGVNTATIHNWEANIGSYPNSVNQVERFSIQQVGGEPGA